LADHCAQLVAVSVEAARGLAMKKQDVDTRNQHRATQAKSMNWELATHSVTEEEIDTIKNMNWEWYYNCYIFRDETIEVVCKICQGMNIFHPGEMKKKCEHCGIECHRCEVSEDDP
jgi:hypothetical protein